MPHTSLLLRSPHWKTPSSALSWRSAPTGRLPQGTVPATLEASQKWAREQIGQFAAVIQTADSTLLITDFARSIPLFYTRVAGGWLISDDINALLASLDRPSRDDEAAEQFRHAGFVLGRRTLVKDIFQVPAATIVEIPHTGHPSSMVYKRFRYNRTLSADNNAFGEEVLRRLRESVQEVVDLADDRLIALPLSGGIDSRLLAVLVAQCQPRNLLAFTYGIAGSREAAVSQQVAAQLGIPWVFVDSDPHAVRNAWLASGTDFLKQAWAGASLPHYQDWYALKVLTDNGTLPPGSIILPGHTIVGNLHNSQVLDIPASLSRAQFAQAVLPHHLGLQGTPAQAAALPYVHQAMSEFFDEVGYDGSQIERQSVIEWFNIRERQAKYINNSMRAYEHFSLDWALPMLSMPVVEIWECGSVEATDEARIWYGQLTAELYAQATGQDITYFAAGVATLPPRWKEIGVSAAEKTGLATFLRRALSARVQLRHPMAFQALLGNRAPHTVLPRIMTGSSMQGAFADFFLEGTWIDDTPIVPPGQKGSIAI